MADQATAKRPEPDFEVTADGTAIPTHPEDAGLPLPQDLADKVAHEPDPMEADEPEANQSTRPGEFDERQIPLDLQRGARGPEEGRDTKAAQDQAPKA